MPSFASTSLERPATQRFRFFSPPTQQKVVSALRQQVRFPELWSPVPAAEWLRLLQLTDPLILVTDGQRPVYQVAEGHLLWELLGHYLDVS